MSERRKWGTWEELLLAGAILRHGTDDWNSVSKELNSRNFFFTIKECQAKYEDIQEQYSGCKVWLEELRQKRVAELRRELEKTEDSIGSLHSKLESLTSDRETRSNSGCNASNTELASPIEYTNADSSVKVISTDESSAGSLMAKREKNCSGSSGENKPKIQNCSGSSGENNKPKIQNCSGSFGENKPKIQNCSGSSGDNKPKIQNCSGSSGENKPKMQTLEDFAKENFHCGCFVVSFGNFKKKRGTRKRRFCTNNILRENSLGESAIISSAANIEKSSVEDDTRTALTEIMDLVTKHEDVSIFKCRLESQKRARYKKMIRRHVDLRSIRTRITNGSISSSNELFRDLLLLCNNAIVFYPKNSLEHKCALSLRELVIKTLKKKLGTHPRVKEVIIKQEEEELPPLVEANANLHKKKFEASVGEKSPNKKVSQRAIRKSDEGVNRARKRSRK